MPAGATVAAETNAIAAFGKRGLQGTVPKRAILQRSCAGFVTGVHNMARNASIAFHKWRPFRPNVPGNCRFSGRMDVWPVEQGSKLWQT